MNVLEAFELYRFFHSGEDETLALRGVSLRVGVGELSQAVILAAIVHVRAEVALQTP